MNNYFHIYSNITALGMFKLVDILNFSIKITRSTLIRLIKHKWLLNYSNLILLKIKTYLNINLLYCVQVYLSISMHSSACCGYLWSSSDSKELQLWMRHEIQVLGNKWTSAWVERVLNHNTIFEVTSCNAHWYFITGGTFKYYQLGLRQMIAISAV